jgi:predicted RNase H-like nuclease/predicted enzyme related to lactoylglutathione lyase
VSSSWCSPSRFLLVEFVTPHVPDRLEHNPLVTDTRLGFVVVRVRDVAASAWFYREAFGVPFEAGEPVQLRAEASWKDGASLRLALLPPEDEATPSVELGFVVDDLEAAHARAAGAGAEVVREPRNAPSGRTAAYLDPDGNLVTLTQRHRALRVAGVDLARGALAVVVLEDDRVVEAFRCETFADALLVDARVVAVDVPIGIPEAGPRAADVAARHFVGGRAASVFTTPIRRALEAATYAEARSIASELTGKSLSAQSYALGRRILEVDEYAHRDERVIEVHPEVSFRELAHRPLPSKNRLEGLAERRTLLEQEGIELPASAPRIAEPDLLDATVAAWSARRYALGEALPLPEGHTARVGAIWR